MKKFKICCSKIEGNQEPRTKNQEPRTKNREPRTENKRTNEQVNKHARRKTQDAPRCTQRSEIKEKSFRKNGVNEFKDIKKIKAGARGTGVKALP
jgi:hypothetical protein